MLRRGQRFMFDGAPFRVAYVNDSRAHCVSETKRTVTVSNGDGSTRTFTATERRAIDVSPDSDFVALAEALADLRRSH